MIQIQKQRLGGWINILRGGGNISLSGKFKHSAGEGGIIFIDKDRLRIRRHFSSWKINILMSLSTCGVHEFCREKFKLV